MIGCSLLLLIPLPIFQFALVIRDGEGAKSEENGTVVPILPTPIPSNF